ncbi:hypothetical protein BKA93DRAFT_929402 [Sparassis latifolia]
MGEPPGFVAQKDLAHRGHALITPSASPPVSRLLFPSYARKRDRPPTTKRPRLSSTPSSSLSKSTRSTSTYEEQKAIVQERSATSIDRLKNVWDQLEERYSRPVEDDDIIDLFNHKILTDRGAIRGSSKAYEMGLLADDARLSDANDANSEGGGAETEFDDVDELDAFTPSAKIWDELKLEKEKLNIPPVQDENPTDAQHLQEFLEAERRRKEQYGDIDEEEVDFRLRFFASASNDEEWCDTSDEADCYEDTDADEQLGEGSLSDLGHSEDEKDDDDFSAAQHKTKASRVPLDEESEDELATWDIDESTPVPRVAHPSVPPAHVIDLTESPPISLRPAKHGRSKSLAREKSMPPSPSRFRSKSRARSKTPARTKTAPTRSPSPTRVAQLFTPPQSSSSAIEGTPGVRGFDDLPRPSPRARPEPKSRRKDLPSDTPPVAGPSSHAEVPIPTWDTPLPRPKIVKKALRPRLIPEVVIITKSSRTGLAKKVSKDAVDIHANGEDDEEPALQTRIPRKDKGKGREVIDPDAVHNLLNQRERPATPSKSAAAKGTRTAVEVLDHDKSPKITVPSSSRGRKRKRVISSSSLSGQSTREEPDTAPVVTTPRRRRRTIAELRSHSSSAISRTKRAVSEQPGDGSDFDPGHDAQGSSRGDYHDRRSSSSAPHPFMHPHPQPHTPYRNSRHPQYPPIPPIQDPQAQYQIAQAIQHLSYLMNAAIGIPPGQGFPDSYSPQYLGHPPPWPPYTPTHTRHRSRQPQLFGSPSSGVGASGSSSSAFTTPMHKHHAYPYGFDPSFSGATLPPSSPISSPEPSSPISPIDRGKSIARARSKSRGRRVSFKLTDDDRPLPPTPRDDSADDDPRERTASQSRQGRDSKPAMTSALRAKAKGRNTAQTLSTGSSTSASAKGKSLAQHDDSDAEEDTVKSSSGNRGRRLERGRTPAPPSQRERGASARAKSRGPGKD